VNTKNTHNVKSGYWSKLSNDQKDKYNGYKTEGERSSYLLGIINTSASSMADKLESDVTGVGPGVQKLNDVLAAWKEVQQTVENLGSNTMGTVAGITLNLLEEEAGIRREIVKDLGQTGILQERTTKAIFNASVATAKYDINAQSLQETLTSVGEVVGRNISFTDEEIERLAVFQKAFNLSVNQVGDMVKQFDQMGYTIEKSIQSAEEMADVARLMGVNMEGFMSNMVQNMDMLNTYNFADGVKGFAKMAAQSERLGISMSTTAALAEKVMDPEGAIDLAANLQVIGGAVGDLADPFKLMYMATNDLGGLQDAIVDAGQSLAVFNDETGEISFPPTAQRQLRAMADALGMNKEEFAGMVKMQAKFEAASNQMNLSAFTGPDAEGMKEFVTSMAKMGEGGRYQIELEDKAGHKEMVNLSDLTKQQVDELKKVREQQEMTSDEIALEQLSALDAIKNSLITTPQAAMKAGLIENLELGKIQVAGIETIQNTLPDESFSRIGDEVGKGVKAGIETIFGASYDDILGGASKGGNFLEAGGMTGLELVGDLISTANEATINVTDGTVVYGGKVEKKEDFMMPADGKSKLIFGGPEGPVLSAPDDIISGYRGKNLASTMDSAIGGGATSTPIVVKFEGMPTNIPITLKGVGELANFNWQQLISGPNGPLFMANLKQKLHETNLTGTPDYQNINDGGGVLSSRGLT